MDDVVAVQIDQCQGDIVGDVDLDVVGEGGSRVLQESSEALLHQLHQEDGSVVGRIMCHTQELHNAGVLQFSQDGTLLIETSGKAHCSWVVGSEEDGVQNFGSTGEVVIQRGFNDISIGTCSKYFGHMYMEVIVAK